MDNEKRLNLRLSSDELVLLTELVYLRKFNSEAEAVRSAVRKLLEESFSPEEMKNILEKSKTRQNLNLSMFTSDGTDAEKVLGNVILRGLESKRGSSDD